MSGTPSVSIAIRAFRRRWLAAAVASVLDQTRRDLELVVYDDAGALRDVAGRFDDPRVRYHRPSEHLDASGRFAAAVRLCRGSYVGLLDDDDQYEPEFVDTMAGALDAHPDAAVAFCRAAWLYGERRYAHPAHVDGGVHSGLGRWLVTSELSIRPSTMLIRRSALEAVWHARPLPRGVAPDAFVNVSLSRAGWSHVHVPQRLVTCRRHADQISLSPASYDVAVATWDAIEVDPDLESCRRSRLGRALLARALFRLADGDADAARDDIARAATTAPELVARTRTIRAIARSGPLGSYTARVLVARRAKALEPRGLIPLDAAPH